MTGERFTLAYEKGKWWAVRDGDITLWKEEVISLLNELHEENEQLEKQSNSVYEIVKEYVMSHHCISTMRMLKKIEEVMWNDYCS